MQKNKIFALSVLALALNQVVYAAEDNVQSLDPVVVSATRTEERLSKVPASAAE